MRRLPAFLIVATSIIGSSSCREELCYNHFGSAEVNFQWPTGPSQPEFPDGVTILVYGEDSETPTTHFISADGGNINFGGSDIRSMLLYNNDTRSILLYGLSSPTSAYATSTPSGHSASKSVRELHPDEPVLNPPDMLYAAYIDILPEVDTHESIPLPVSMDPLVFSYEIYYEFEYGLHRVTHAKGTLSGMAEYIIMHNGATKDSRATLVFDCKLTESGIHAHLLSFGAPGYSEDNITSRENRRNTLALDVRLTNGKTKSFSFDISGQIESQPRGGSIIVSGLRIEDNEGSSDSGFDVGVDDWGDHEYIDFPIGWPNGKSSK